MSIPINKIRGVTTFPCREKIGVRLRRNPFDKSLTIQDSRWDNPTDHKKVEQIINEGLIKTEWLPSCIESQKRLYEHLYKNHGCCKDIYMSYKQTKLHEPISFKDPILTELRLIRNYLEKLTLEKDS